MRGSYRRTEVLSTSGVGHAPARAMPARVDLSGSTVAVTGATGFLGSYLVDKLLSRGARVIAVARTPQKAADLARRGAEVRKADLAHPSALRDAFAGADAVIANAAVISFTHPRETYATNVEGTRHVFEAMAQAGVKRAVAISSTAAYPPSPFVRREDAPLRKRESRAPWAVYGASKALSEQLAWALSAQHGIALTTFRPCGISGARDPLLMGALQVLGRLPVVVLPAFTRIGVVHADDVAEAVALALERPAVSAGKAYNLQGDTVSLWRIASAFRAAGGRMARLRMPVPFPYLLRYDDTRARHELGWQPRGIANICEDAVNAARRA
jgi:nucleoside-diphosphate-sugar epimerase